MIKNGKTYRAENMIFDLGTTSREDYRFGEIITYPPTVYKPKPRCLRVPPPSLKNIHTLTEWSTRCPYVPFYLFHKGKEITQTDPRIVQKKYTEPVDLEREEIQKTRPRVCMFPELAFDDVPEPTRQLLMNSIYSTTATRAMEEGAVEILPKNNNTIKAPLPGVFAKADVVRKLPRLSDPYVSPEWRMDSVKWNERQDCTFADSTKMFWLQKKLTCQECKDTAARKAQQQLINPC